MLIISLIAKAEGKCHFVPLELKGVVSLYILMRLKPLVILRGLHFYLKQGNMSLLNDEIDGSCTFISYSYS